MSDLQDLIHTNAHNAYEIGVRTERQRIITLLENMTEEFTRKEELERYLAKVKEVLNERV